MEWGEAEGSKRDWKKEELDWSEVEMTRVEWNGRRGVQWSGVKRRGNGVLECEVEEIEEDQRKEWTGVK